MKENEIHSTEAGAKDKQAQETKHNNIENPSPCQIMIGLAYFLGGIICFAFQALMIKVMLKRYNLSVPEVSYHICAALTGVQYAYAKLTCKSDIFEIPRETVWPLFFRCLSGFLCDVLLYTAFEFTSYSKAFCMFMTNTLVSPFMARYLLNESVKVADVVGVCLGFIGMILLVNPFGDNSNIQSIEASSLKNDIIGVVIGLLSSVTSALSIVYARMVSDKVHHAIPPVYYIFLATLSTPVWFTLFPQTAVVDQTLYSLEMYAFVGATLIVQSMQNIFFALSWQYNSVGILAVLIYLSIPFGYFLDWLFIGREFSAMELLGAGLIFAVNILIVSLRLLKVIE